MEINKIENIIEFYFENNIYKTWTYARLTKEEKERLKEVFFCKQTEDCIKGRFEQKWRTLGAIYHSFLMALDYNPINWREENEEEIPLF